MEYIKDGDSQKVLKDVFDKLWDTVKDCLAFRSSYLMLLESWLAIGFSTTVWWWVLSFSSECFIIDCSPGSAVASTYFLLIILCHLSFPTNKGYSCLICNVETLSIADFRCKLCSRSSPNLLNNFMPTIASHWGSIHHRNWAKGEKQTMVAFLD